MFPGHPLVLSRQPVRSRHGRPSLPMHLEVPFHPFFQAVRGFPGVLVFPLGPESPSSLTRRGVQGDRGHPPLPFPQPLLWAQGHLGPPYVRLSPGAHLHQLDQEAPSSLAGLVHPPALAAQYRPSLRVLQEDLVPLLDQGVPLGLVRHQVQHPLLVPWVQVHLGLPCLLCFLPGLVYQHCRVVLFFLGCQPCR